MRRLIAHFILPAAAALAGGCAFPAGSVTARGAAPFAEPTAREVAEQQEPAGSNGKQPDRGKETDGKEKEEGKAKEEKAKEDVGKAKGEKAKGPPKALFEWAIGPPEEERANDDDWIVTDRPDFTESATTVGRGRVQLEAGYTYTRDRSTGATRITQTYPEALLRIGVLAEWLELRIGPNYVHTRLPAFGPTTEHLSGLDDLYVGAKVALTEEKGYLPELGIIFQATVPTGGPGISSEQTLPGVNFLFGLDVIKDLLSVSGSFQANRAIDPVGHSYVELAQSVSLGYTITKQFGAYTEWFAFYPTSALSPGVSGQHYFNLGLTYKITPDFQVDVRTGWGLSRSADDFFAGAGFAVRY